MAKKEDVCENCESYTKCVSAACKCEAIRCVNFGKLIQSIIDTVEKFNSIPNEYLCTLEELEALYRNE